MKFKTRFFNSKNLPLVIEPEEKTSADDFNCEFLIALCIENRELFHNELLGCGALLFRGFSIKSADNFERVARALSGKNLLDYAGGVSPRVELTKGGVYTSTEYPPRFMIPLHNELSYSNNYPSQVYFCCLVAPEEGGETPIGDSRAILKNIDARIVEEFKLKKLRYERNLQGDAGSGYSWQDAFETNDKSTVEDCCRRMDADFEWKKNGGLRVSQIRPATTIHPETSEEVWFNQADGFHPSIFDEETRAATPEDEFRLNVRFADGSPLDIEKLNRIREVLRNEMVIFPWQEGDVLVLDNILTAHGRMPFCGARKIILAMT